MLAEISAHDTDTLFLILGIVCLAGAAYCAYLSRVEACVLLLVVGLVCLLVL